MLNNHCRVSFLQLYIHYVRSFVVYNHNTTTDKINWWIIWKGPVKPILPAEEREFVCEGVPIIVDYFFLTIHK